MQASGGTEPEGNSLTRPKQRLVTSTIHLRGVTRAVPPVGGLAEFEQLASAQGKTPFDLLAEMLVN